MKITCHRQLSSGKRKVIPRCILVFRASQTRPGLDRQWAVLGLGLRISPGRHSEADTYYADGLVCRPTITHFSHLLSFSFGPDALDLVQLNELVPLYSSFFLGLGQ
jgi:hypothetical protein